MHLHSMMIFLRHQLGIGVGVSSVADDNESQGLHSLTTEIVASFVGNNVVAIGDLPAVIAAVFKTLRSVTQGEAEKPTEMPLPAVPIKKSIGKDYLICLEDGQKGSSRVRPHSWSRGSPDSAHGASLGGSPSSVWCPLCWRPPPVRPRS